jgi:hypothetical protein
MNSTSTPKAIEPHNALIARADEQLAQAHEQIAARVKSLKASHLARVYCMWKARDPKNGRGELL